MTQFFESIADSFSAIVDFVVQFVENILMIIRMIGRSVLVVFNLIIYMPVTIQVIMIALVSYIIIINITQKGG